MIRRNLIWLMLVLFLSACNVNPLQGEMPPEELAVPTVSGYFEVISVATPRPTKTMDPIGITEVGTVPESTAADIEEIVTEVIFDDELSDNWRSLKSPRMDIDLSNDRFVQDGFASVEITPGEDFGAAYFVVQSDSNTAYLHDRVLALEFWINSGNSVIETGDLAVTVFGSNEYAHFVTGDTSVTNNVDPVFPETRLYYLDINRMIPPNTWVPIELWLDDIVYDPDYKYVTGFYIKNDEGFRESFYIDNIQLTMLDTPINKIAVSTLIPDDDPGFSTSENNKPVAVGVKINALEKQHTISPMVYGVSVAPQEVVESLLPGINSWGGNPNTRYNWEIGNAWNAGRDYFYRNGNYDNPPGNVADQFIEATTNAGAEVRLSIPTLGWVAKNADIDTCSFPLPDGSCWDADNASCQNPGEIADPELANVSTNTDFILQWLRHIYIEQEFNVRIIAMDNEPELWGITHYDVHPECTTYQEILEKYLEYSTAIRQEFPEAELAGPVACCWYYYWESAAGLQDKILNRNQDFLPWFLDQVYEYDSENNIQTIDVLDIHYYPEGLYNPDIDPETSAHRMRSTRSLWDSSYVDESWINEPIFLVPRMKEIIEQYYPGLKLGISEWNFGGWGHINGAIAVADVLGIFGREDVYYANYYGYPELGTPEYYGFKIFSNYDDKGGRFGDTSVQIQSQNPDMLGAYGAVDSETGNFHIVLINKTPDVILNVEIDQIGFDIPSNTTLYRYSAENLDEIMSEDVSWSDFGGNIELPPYSISHFVLQP